MALKNTKNNYLRISSEDVNAGIIEYDVYKNEQSRINGLGEFEKTEQNRVIIPIDLNVVPPTDSTGLITVKNLIRTQSYVALKSLPEFDGWEDC